MRVVITGGNGYIGARLSQYLAEKGFEVIPFCFSKIPDNSEWKSKMFAIYQGDIRKEETIALITDLNPDAIIHLVSLDHFESEKGPRLANDINVLPTWNLLDSCCKNGLSKFIFFSTVQVYGKLENCNIDEKHQTNTGNAYGLTHNLSENICDYYNRKTNTNVITVRLSNSYGDPIFPENNCWWLAINDLCKKAFLNKEICLLSDGSPQRDFIHGNDVCQAIERLLNLNSKSMENNIYHISSGETVTLYELAIAVRDVYKKRYNQMLPISTPNGVISDSGISPVIERYTISNEKLKNIDFSPDYNIFLGINELFNYLENNSNGVAE